MYASSKRESKSWDTYDSKGSVWKYGTGSVRTASWNTAPRPIYHLNNFCSSILSLIIFLHPRAITQKVSEDNQSDEALEIGTGSLWQLHWKHFQIAWIFQWWYLCHAVCLAERDVDDVYYYHMFASEVFCARSLQIHVHNANKQRFFDDHDHRYVVLVAFDPKMEDCKFRIASCLFLPITTLINVYNEFRYPGSFRNNHYIKNEKY